MAAERILIVSDDPDVRSQLAGTLDGLPYAPVLVSGVTDVGSSLSHGAEYDLVLYDLPTKGLEGMAVLEHLRGLRPQTPIVVTVDRDIGAALSAMRKGAYDIVLKPFEREHLLPTVRRALDHRKLLLQNSLYQHDLEKLVAARTDMLRQAISEIEHSYDITLEALGDALDLKDAETEGHSKRVTAFTIVLARSMGLHPEEIRVMARGAFLHDIGKMAIPDAILLKPGRLDALEQFTMREHCARGYQMLRKIPFLREAAEIVYSHQEHFDGSGYPRGLKGTEIPLGARIFAVADTLDAITSNRPYRKAGSFSSARTEIQRCSRTQFDPSVVRAYLTMPDQLWEDLRSEITQHARRFSPFPFDENTPSG